MRGSSITWTLHLAENGWLPEPLVRAGIRRLLTQRIQSITETPDLERQVVDAMQRGPIAVETDAANQQHYEVPPEFFRLVLGRHLKYSCCSWPEGVASLDDAEAAGLQEACAHAGVRDGMRILDLGCGWGSLSLWIAERYPSCSVVSVSNSVPQGEFIRGRARARGLPNIEVVTADMNRFDTATRFDRIVSVEMFEHMRNYSLLLERVAGWLECDGKLFVHVFCHRSHPYFFEDNGAGDWMARHFFTGGLMPSEHLLERFAQTLELDERWRVNGRHYERTARAWITNLDRHRAEILELFAATYGPGQARRWLHRWRIFFLSCAELFGFDNGEEWFVSHSLWSRKQNLAH